MGSIVFVARKIVKNAVLDLIHHPTRLIAYSFLALMILSGAFAQNIDVALDPEASEALTTVLDVGFLHGGFMALLLFVGVPVFLYGLQSGTTLFSMSDVNYLFVSPVSQKKLLVYGMSKRMGAILLFALLFIVYINNIRMLFNISMFDCVLLAIAFCVYIFFCQLMSLVFYCISNGKKRVIFAIKTIVFACAAMYPAIIAFNIYQNGFSLDTLVEALKNPLGNWVPFFGWIKGMMFGIMSGDYLSAVVFGILIASLLSAAMIYFLKSSPDYYEDVLQNTESTYEMRQAMKKEGPFSQKRDYWANRKIKVRSTGLNGGWGASAFFFKHLCEMRRRGRIIFLDLYTIMLAAIIGFMVYLMNLPIDENGEAAPRLVIIIMAICMSVYMQFIFIQVGDWSRELLKPSIYLVPEKPYNKLFFASLSALCKSAIEGILAFTAVGIILGLNPLEVFVCVLFYLSFGFIFTSVSIFSSRFIGDVNNKIISMMVYSIALVVVCLPGVLATGGLAAVHYLSPEYCPNGFITLLPIAIWNIAAALLINIASKETLHNMEAKV